MRQGLKAAELNDFLALSEGWHELFGLGTIKKKPFNLNTSVTSNGSSIPTLSFTEISNLLSLTVSGIVAPITLTLKAVHVTLERLLKRIARIKSLTTTVKTSMSRIHCRSNVIEKYANLPVNLSIPLSASDRAVPSSIIRSLSSTRDSFSAEYHILLEHTSICLAANHGITAINDFSAL
jgi:hypothetical protein